MESTKQCPFCAETIQAVATKCKFCGEFLAGPPGSARPVGAGEFAACPTCGRYGAQRVGYTWWGGWLGPKMFHHVKCPGCGTQYNGKTGKSNTTAIVIYSIVAMVLVIGIIIAVNVLK